MTHNVHQRGGGGLLFCQCFSFSAIIVQTVEEGWGFVKKVQKRMKKQVTLWDKALFVEKPPSQLHLIRQDNYETDDVTLIG